MSSALAHSRRLAVLLATLVITAGVMLVAAAPAEASLDCSQANIIDRTGAWEQVAVIQHTCGGSGTVDYTVNCGLARGNVTATRSFSPPYEVATLEIDCGWGGYPFSLSYRVV